MFSQAMHMQQSLTFLAKSIRENEPFEALRDKYKHIFAQTYTLSSCVVTDQDLSFTPLCFAIYYHRSDVVRAFVELGKSDPKFNLDYHDHHGWSACLVAAFRQNLEALELLLRSGAALCLVSPKDKVGCFGAAEFALR